MHLREQLRPYIDSLYRAAADSGAPVIRMLLYEFSNDAQAAHVSDQFMLGIRHAARWHNEPRSQAEWDAWGYFLHGAAAGAA